MAIPSCHKDWNEAVLTDLESIGSASPIPLHFTEKALRLAQSIYGADRVDSRPSNFQPSRYNCIFLVPRRKG